MKYSNKISHRKYHEEIEYLYSKYFMRKYVSRNLNLIFAKYETNSYESS